jgi:hypothetical protein
MKILLVRALKNRFNMTEEDAKSLVKILEEIFEGKDEIEDMTFDKYVRQLFYDLQKERLLKQRREEFKENGKIIRKYYWSFDNEMIKQAAYEQINEDPYKIYKNIPKEAWLVHSYCS